MSALEEETFRHWSKSRSEREGKHAEGAAPRNR